jgi:protein TonB
MNRKSLSFFLLFFLVSKISFGQASCISDPDTIDGGKVYTISEVMPKFPGGDEALLKFFHDNLKYPSVMKEELQGKVTVTFVIDSTGHVRNLCILKPRYSNKLTELENTILSLATKLPVFNPGEMNGRKVANRLTLPIYIDFR